ncbi:hypothetical protein [Nostoc cycadae]|uniref:Heat shock protein DnaJ domain-containing protein n=1 Tax=Nostoc cycadae WK-1 TaxID=1861711 RepID=A0A2H6LQM8_9NOSO|nr:hypothetical protein [Nostoc cycadae]GBE95512.1 heat shock protein DnaJ domain-containing protein [Nostoc cycadae WK-1]
MIQNSKTGAAFIAGGSLAGAGVSATVGGMGLAGGFGAVGMELRLLLVLVLWLVRLFMVLSRL